MKGSCLCGEIQYEVDEVQPAMAHCHCSMCRKFHGAAFATFGEATQEDFRWIKGQDLLAEYKADNGTTRRFCSKCGSSLIFVPSSGDESLVEFALSTLDDVVNIQPDAHIFTRYKASWFDITDKLPQFSEGRSSEKLNGSES